MALIALQLRIRVITVQYIQLHTYPDLQIEVIVPKCLVLGENENK